MRIALPLLFSFGLTLTTAAPTGSSPYVAPPGTYEAIHQAEFDLAVTLDKKEWDQLSRRMTQDIMYRHRVRVR